MADLAELPDDGLRYELVDETLLVNPAPTTRHQRAIGRLYLLLTAACPPHLEVFVAPTDYQPTRTRSLQPDLLVVRRDDPGENAVTTPLALAVEVLSPSSRSIDRVLKRELYEQAGVQAYWVVDPAEATVTRLDAAVGDVRRAAHRGRPHPARPAGAVPGRRGAGRPLQLTGCGRSASACGGPRSVSCPDLVTWTGLGRSPLRRHQCGRR